MNVLQNIGTCHVYQKKEFIYFRLDKMYCVENKT